MRPLEILSFYGLPLFLPVSENYHGRLKYLAYNEFYSKGLLSLTVEFFRTTTSSCTKDDSGNPISPTEDGFPYNITCGFDLSNISYSPLRGGEANNIYVIPAPDRLTFGTATIIAAACCIPATLSLVSMLSKILDINWHQRFVNREEDNELDQSIEGLNSSTLQKLDGVNNLIRILLNVIEVPIFGSAILIILIIGEMNFSSPQVSYLTAPISSFGKCSPLYMLITNY